MNLFLIILLAIAIGIAVIEDIRRQKIPNLVTFPTMVLAIGYHCLSGGLDGFLFAMGGLAIGVGLFLIPYLMGGMGAGDAKLMGAAGAIFGPEGICVASVIVYLAGGVYAAILWALNPGYASKSLKRIWMTIKTFVLTFQLIIIAPPKDEKQPVLKFAIPIAVGTLSYLYINLTGYHVFAHLLRNMSGFFSA